MKKIEDRKQKLEVRSQKVGFGFIIMLLLITTVFLACQDVKKPIRPKNLIPKEKMATILVDIYISNAARSVNNKILINKGIKLDSIIYEKYSIDSLQFVESNAFYSSDLNTYNGIISEVEKHLILLNEEKDSIYKLIRKERGDTITSKTNFKSNKLINPAESKKTDSLQLKSLK